MKKKIIGSLLALAALVAVAVPSQKAEAQVYSNRCCNAYNVVTCIVDNGAFPLGSPCTCACCPGVGYIC